MDLRDRERVDAYLESKRDEMLRDLEMLVRINSQKGPAAKGRPFGDGPAAALAAAQELMERYGLTVKNYDNYVVTGDTSLAPKGLDILAHLDVVPATKDWTVTQPFEPRILDGRIYGRGSADDKGPAVAALYALRAVCDLKIPMKKSVRLVLGSDEECGSGDLAYYYGIEKEAPYTFTPDADFPVINIEKGRLEAHFDASFQDADAAGLPCVRSLKSGEKANVVPGRAVLLVQGLQEEAVRSAAYETEKETGVFFSAVRMEGEKDVLRIEAHGQAAHASLPAEGKNALTAALRLVTKLPLAESEGLRALCALDALFPYEDTCGKTLGVYRQDAQSGDLTLCFSMLEYTPEQLKGTFDARLPVSCTEENTRRPIADLLAQHGFRMRDSVLMKPHCVPGDSAFVKILLDSYERYTGVRGEPLSTGGGTYVHELERGVAFGCMMPGVDNHMHGDDEFMVIDTLVMSAKIFADAIVRICNEL